MQAIDAAEPKQSSTAKHEVTAQVTGEVTGEVLNLLQALTRRPLNRVEVQANLNLQSQANFMDRYLMPALAAALIERTIPEKPNSRLQKYLLTGKGRELAGKTVSQ